MRIRTRMKSAGFLRISALLLLWWELSYGFVVHPRPSAVTNNLGKSVAATQLSSSPTHHKDADNVKPPISPNSQASSTVIEDDQDYLLKRQKKLVRTIKSFLFDVLYAGSTIDRSYARFYALETIARMPYFSYLSVLHLLETLGKWRQADRLALHFAESWNELHHLLVMEELLTKGENRPHDVAFFDRFVAQHVAFFYYWFAVGLYLFQPSTAYSLNQAIEEEAYDTYDFFLQTHGDFLKQQPAPAVAKNYYTGTGQDLFDRMHLSQHTDLSTPRRVVHCETLYDCFVAIRDDELEHSKSMDYLKRYKNNEDLPVQ
jgi:ubiquinol oxidase